MKKQLLSSIIVLLISISYVTANLDNLNLGLNYSNAGEYMKSIELLEKICPNFKEDIYHAAQCYFVLGYDYYMEFNKRAIIIIEHEKGKTLIGHKENVDLISESNKNFIKAVNLSWVNLTPDDLKKSNRTRFLLSSVIFLSHNYFIINDYNNAQKYLEVADKILSGAPASQKNKKMQDLINKLYSFIPKKVEIELIGDVDPISFSQPEIKPNIILESDENIYFNILHTDYVDLKGYQSYNIENKDNSFIFNKKLILNKKNVFLFPFDSYYSEIFNITPSKIRSSSLVISMIGEDSNLEGIGYFSKDKINLSFKRNGGYRLRVILFTLILMGFLIYSNYKIKDLKKSSLRFKNILKNWLNVLLPIASLLVFITISFKAVFNLINIIIISLIIFIMFNLFRKLKKLKVFSP